MTVTILVRTTCPTCGGDGVPPHEFHIGSDHCEVCQGDIVTYCTTCTGTGTVVDAERAKWLRTVAEWAAEHDPRGDLGIAPPLDIHVLAKAVLA